jgi:hypothetical protein
MQLDEYGYARRHGGWFINSTDILALWDSWFGRKKRRDAELDAKNKASHKRDAEWEAIVSKPSGDDDLKLFHEMRTLRMRANRHIDGNNKRDRKEIAQNAMGK